MASKKEEKFFQAIEEKAFDLHHRQILSKNIQHYTAAFEDATQKFAHLDNSKKKAHLIKWRTIENIERFLLDFESNFTRNGGQVVWANSAQEAQEEIGKIIRRRQATKVIKSHSMVAEEIGLQDYLHTIGVDYTETDLGRWIAQLNQDRPSHVIHSALHLSQEDIVQLFQKEQHLPSESTIDDVIKYATEHLREQLTQSSVAITGANFIVADSGSIVLTDNEGNSRLQSAFAHTHIVLAGIDKIISSLGDLDLFLPLTHAHDHGQLLTANTLIWNGPRNERETDGPEEMIVILIDNGRSDVLAHKEQRQALYWMECGASTNTCEIYKSIGGHAYQTTYPGPMGAIFESLMNRPEDYHYLSNIAYSSGQNNMQNPLNIDIQRLSLLNRRDAVEKKKTDKSVKKAIGWYSKFAKSRKLLDFFGKGIKNFLLSIIVKKNWGKRRRFPKISGKSFSQQWQSLSKEKD